MNNRLSKLREKRANGDGGFTLIELLVVVVILGILIAIAIPLYLNYRKGANDTAAKSDVRNAISVLETCNSDNGTYPATITVTGSVGAPAGCGQSINLSANTTIRYTPAGAAGAYTSYVFVATNSGGNNKIWCYNSGAGGQVAASTTASMSTANTAC